MTTMLKGKDKLPLAALMALLASSLRSDQTLDRRGHPGHVRASISPEATQRQREIIEWNSAVDARKAAKRARKGTKR